MSEWVIIGSYSCDAAAGGLRIFRREDGGLRLVCKADRKIEAGYVVHDPRTDMVYAVDERKSDGRGPVGPEAGVHAFAFDRSCGVLTWKGFQATPGPFPTYLDLHSEKRALLSASHGSFDHVQRVVPAAGGGWTTEFVYDASTVILHRLAADGGFNGICDLHVLEGHGLDPNSKLQAGGHCQSSAHAHCATLDPSGQFVVVCDKGTDSILTYRLADRLEAVAEFQFPPETAPRHVAFCKDGQRMFVTLELSSELAAMEFDPATGRVALIGKTSTVAAGFDGPNEPAELRLSPDEAHVYVNNRGEDSLAWFGVDPDGALTRKGHVQVAKSIHPGLAARSFAILPDGQSLLFADRPADLLRIYSLDPATGAARETSALPVPAPVFVSIIPDHEAAK